MKRFATFALIIAGSAAGLAAAGIARSDQTFATKAAAGGMAEVQLGQLAVSKTTNQQVKDFGQKMVDDHSKANDELKSLAAQENISLPSKPSSKDQALMSRLSGLSGSAFDKAYMSAMVKDHEEDISEFQKEANSGADSGLKNFASKTLPTLKEHLRMAKQTAQAAGTK